MPSKRPRQMPPRRSWTLPLAEADSTAELLALVRDVLDRSTGWPGALPVIREALALFRDPAPGWLLSLSSTGHIGTMGGELHLRVECYLKPKPAPASRPAAGADVCTDELSSEAPADV